MTYPLRATSLCAFAILSAIPLASQAQAPAQGVAADTAAIAAAVAATTRAPANVARDVHRRPAETLAFFEITPGETVLEYSPGGGGWYTEILAPLTAGKGTLYAAQAKGGGFDALGKKLAADAATFGHVKLVEWPPVPGSVADGSVDTILTFRNVHNMVMNGSAEANFKRFFELLKPGGTLGIVDHRLPEDRDSALEKTSGYLKVSTVRALAERAGFVLDAQSELNANPKDSADWPNGVWTLPPTFRLGDTDRAKYAAIGESDRMTLRFRKPE